nr:hypothetical protein Iba_chr14eCG4280 [Ipomoea batatas]
MHTSHQSKPTHCLNLHKFLLLVPLFSKQCLSTRLTGFYRTYGIPRYHLQPCEALLYEAKESPQKPALQWINDPCGQSFLREALAYSYFSSH